MGRRITDWLEHTVEDQLKLSINREKTEVVKMKQQGETLDFLDEDSGIKPPGLLYWFSFRIMTITVSLTITK